MTQILVGLGDGYSAHKAPVKDNWHSVGRVEDTRHLDCFSINVKMIRIELILPKEEFTIPQSLEEAQGLQSSVTERDPCHKKCLDGSGPLAFEAFDA